jgi:hypothetical protein
MWPKARVVLTTKRCQYQTDDDTPRRQDRPAISKGLRRWRERFQVTGEIDSVDDEHVLYRNEDWTKRTLEKRGKFVIRSPCFVGETLERRWRDKLDRVIAYGNLRVRK